MRSLHLLLILALGCNGTDKEADPTDTDAPVDTDQPDDTDPPDTDPPVACTATVVAVTPANNSTLVAVDTTVVAEFSAAITADDHFDIVLSDSNGPVAGSLDLASDGRSATFVPAADLALDAPYSLTLEVCEASISGGFRTVPGPIDPLLVEGRTFGILYGDVVFIEPQNTALLAADFDYILVQVDTVDEVALTFEGAAATANDVNGDVVPNCDASVRAPTCDLSANPLFTVGPTNLTYAYSGGELNLQLLTLDGRFSQDGEAMLDVYLRGLVDPEDVMPGLNCAAAAFLVAGTCLPCPATPGDCLLIEAEAPRAAWLPDVDVVGTCAL